MRMTNDLITICNGCVMRQHEIHELRHVLNNNGYGLSVIAKLKETPIKRNLYYEIKDKILEETFDNGKIIKKTRKTKVFGLHSTHEIRDTLIELLSERMKYHKDKFVSTTIYNELRGLEVKKNGKIEHSDLTHDDQIFSYLMAMYVWYEGKNLRENFGIQKFGIKTEESVDDIVDLQATEELGDITEQIAFANKSDESKFEEEIKEMQKAKGLLYSEYVKKQKQAESEQLKVMLSNPRIRDAYSKKYGVSSEVIQQEYNGGFMQETLPDSLFIDFIKDTNELGQASIYNTISDQGMLLYDDNDVFSRLNRQKMIDDESLQ